MIAAPVQGDVDGIPKGSHYVSVPAINVTRDPLPLGGRPGLARAIDLTGLIEPSLRVAHFLIANFVINSCFAD